MKKLVMHSDQIKNNTLIDEASMKLFISSSPRIAYIPSKSDKDRKYYQQKCEWYKQFGITKLKYFDIDNEYNNNMNDDLFKYDGIFLSGGDTFHFLNNLKKRDFLTKLKNYVDNGGVLIGVSAGSILMSKTIEIEMIQHPHLIGKSDYSALDLVDFDFFPHFDWNQDVNLHNVIDFSKRRDSVIYCCNDGDGIIINGEQVEFFGEILKVENGTVSVIG